MQETVLSHLKRKAGKLQIAQWTLQACICEEWKWLHVCRVCPLKLHKDENISYKASRKDGLPRMVASSGETCVQLTFLKNLSVAGQAKAMKVHGLKTVKTNFADEHFELVFSFQVHLSFHGYPQSSQMNLSLCLYLHVIVGVGCKLFIRHFHASFVNKIKRFLTPYRLVSTCIFFIKKSLMRSEFWQLQSQWNIT